MNSYNTGMSFTYRHPNVYGFYDKKVDDESKKFI